MGVGVDQPGGDDLARHVDDVARDLRRNPLVDRDDAVAGDRHVGNAVVSGRRIDDAPAAQQSIDFQVGFVGVHGWSSDCAKRVKSASGAKYSNPVA